MEIVFENLYLTVALRSTLRNKNCFLATKNAQTKPLDNNIKYRIYANSTTQHIVITSNHPILKHYQQGGINFAFNKTEETT